MTRNKHHKNETSKKNLFLPTFISRVFDPPVVITVLTALGVIKSELSHENLVLFFLLLPIFIVLPLGYFLWTLKTHQVSNWDISKRKQRIIPLTVLLGFLACDTFIVSQFNNHFLFSMFFIYFLWTAGFLLITLFWKISGHTGITTLAAGLLTLWFGRDFLPFFVFIPVVGWARIVRRDHTIAQVIAGVIYSCVILAIFSLWVY